MPKITFIGAGSTVFAKNLLGDILSYPELAESTISLHDIDPERLRTTEIVAQRIAKTLGAHPTIEATLDRRAALDGADYAISMFQIAGYKPGTVIDFEIPKKYGLRQTIADTLGIGGIMRALRTIPVLLDMCRDMEELCPDVTFLNYVNPMAMNTWAINRASKIKTVGLCHSVQGTAEQLAHDIGVPIEEINYLCAGHQPHGVLPALRAQDAGRRGRPVPAPPPGGRRRPRARLEPGALRDAAPAWATSSPSRASTSAEYVPWFIKRDRPDLIEKFNVPLDEYIRRCEVQIAGWEFAKDSENPTMDPRCTCRAQTRAMIMMRCNFDNRAQPRVRLGDHPQPGDRHAARGLRQCAEPRPDRQPAAGLLRGGALPGG